MLTIPVFDLSRDAISERPHDTRTLDVGPLRVDLRTRSA